MRRISILLATLCLSTFAVAHEGVTNMAVKMRMQAMSGIADNMKTLGQMAKGASAFDADVARLAAARIAAHAADTPELFKALETDPKSEALPLIWEQFDDFTRLSLTLEQVATEVADTLSQQADLRPALARMGETCKNCHRDYRLDD